MVMSSIKALEGGSIRCSFRITPIDVFAALRNKSSMARTKRSGEITQLIMMLISSACYLVAGSLRVNLMKAEFKYFIMISPTLLGKLKSRGPFGLSGVELNFMHCQDHVVLFCPF